MLVVAVDVRVVTGVVEAVEVSVDVRVVMTHPANVPSWCSSMAALSWETALPSELKSLINPVGVQPNTDPETSSRETCETTFDSAAVALIHASIPPSTPSTRCSILSAVLQKNVNSLPLHVRTTC